MVAAFAGAEEVRARAAELRAALVESGERELHAYEPVLAAGSEQERADALSTASEVPMAIARASAEVAELGARVTAESKPALKGDAVAGVLLAESACRAASRLVEINLRGAPDDPRVAEVTRLSESSAQARARALDQV